MSERGSATAQGQDAVPDPCQNMRQTVISDGDSRTTETLAGLDPSKRTKECRPIFTFRHVGGVWLPYAEGTSVWR